MNYILIYILIGSMILSVKLFKDPVLRSAVELTFNVLQFVKVALPLDEYIKFTFKCILAWGKPIVIFISLWPIEMLKES